MILMIATQCRVIDRSRLRESDRALANAAVASAREAFTYRERYFESRREGESDATAQNFYDLSDSSRASAARSFRELAEALRGSALKRTLIRVNPFAAKSRACLTEGAKALAAAERIESMDPSMEQELGIVTLNGDGVVATSDKLYK